MTTWDKNKKNKELDRYNSYLYDIYKRLELSENPELKTKPKFFREQGPIIFSLNQNAVLQTAIIPPAISEKIPEVNVGGRISTDLACQAVTEKFLKELPHEKDAVLDSCPVIFDQFQIPKSRMPYKNMIEKEMQTYKQDLQAGAEKNLEQKHYEKPPLEELRELQNDLISIQEQAANSAENAKKLILKMVKAKPLDQDAQKYFEASRSKRVELELLDCFHALAPDPEQDFEKFQEGLKRINPNLNLEEGKKLRAWIVFYLEQETAIQQINRTLESLEPLIQMEENEETNESLSASLWQKACSNLIEERQYRIQEDYYRTDLSALIFEYLSGYRVRVDQAQKIKTCFQTLFNSELDVEVSGIVFQLIMGGGRPAPFYLSLPILSLTLKEPRFSYAKMSNTAFCSQI